MKSVYTGNVDTTELTAMSPDDIGVEVLEGDPNIRMAIVRDSGEPGGVEVGVARVDPCTLLYSFDMDETVYLLEGEVSVTVDGTSTVELGPGDVASFASGSETRWVFRSPAKELIVAPTRYAAPNVGRDANDAGADGALPRLRR
jgi:uncharacterized protein